MSESEKIEVFLTSYDEAIRKLVHELREVLMQSLPEIKEQLDTPARMIAYCYGQQYKELVCMIIPSKKGLKLGFNAGVSLPDPEGWLEGTGKISRYGCYQNGRDVAFRNIKRTASGCLRCLSETNELNSGY